MDQPLVTVLIPTYDRAPLLREAIDSVRAQTYRHWELIVVDDGSTDGTPALLAVLDEPRLRVLRREPSVGQWRLALAATLGALRSDPPQGVRRLLRALARRALTRNRTANGNGLGHHRV